MTSERDTRVSNFLNHKIIEEEPHKAEVGLTEFLFVDDSRTLSNRDYWSAATFGWSPGHWSADSQVCHGFSPESKVHGDGRVRE